MACLVDQAFWEGRRVLVTGHTGFKGAWASMWLHAMGAKVSGIALEPETNPNLYEIAKLSGDVDSRIGDIRDPEFLSRNVAEINPQIVIHMAAQPLVCRSVRRPVETFETNVMGTVHLLEALRTSNALEAILVITTDKVYENPETGAAFHETDPLGGHDPYSASKAATELVVAAYRQTYFNLQNVPLATARGGNVIGGGDFSEDRIVPDVLRALQENKFIELRNPESSRPWQHILDCLEGYFAFAQSLAQRKKLPESINFGPINSPEITVRSLVESLQKALKTKGGWIQSTERHPKEMKLLSLDCSLAREHLGFTDRLVGEDAVKATADWYIAYFRGDDMRASMLESIKRRLTT